MGAYNELHCCLQDVFVHYSKKSCCSTETSDLIWIRKCLSAFEIQTKEPKSLVVWENSSVLFTSIL